MLKLNKQLIANRCGNPGIYLRAVSYFRDGMVKELEFDASLGCYNARVEGAELYRVHIFCGDDGAIEDVDCNCFAFYSYAGYCKHIAAVLLALSALDPRGEKTREEALVEELTDHYAARNTGRKHALKLVITIRIEKPRWTFADLRTFVSLKVGESKLYVVRNIEQLVCAVQKDEQLVFGQRFTYRPEAHSFLPGDRKALDFFFQLHQFGCQANSRSLLRGKEVELSSELLGRLLMHLKECAFTLEIGGKIYPGVTTDTEGPRLEFTLQEGPEGVLALAPAAGSGLVPLTADFKFILMNNRVYHLPETPQGALLPLLRALYKQPDHSLPVKKAQADRFISAVLPLLEKGASLEVAPDLQRRLYRPASEARVYFDYEDGSLTARLNFSYGDVEVSPFEHPMAEEGFERILIRDMQLEQQVMSIFEQADFKLKSRVMHLDDMEGILRFMEEGLPTLQRYASVYYSDRFKKTGLRPAPRFSGRIEPGLKPDLLELNLELEGIEREELDRIWQSVREKRKYYRLKDGSILSLEGEGVRQLTSLAEALDLQPSDLRKGGIHLPRGQALHIDQLIRDRELTGIRLDKAVEQLVRRIRCPEEAGFSPPPSLTGVLRDYQASGFQWMKALASCGFGGILADDMGLGKTVQAIALILSGKQESKEALSPVLVVAPASVIYNWEAEIKKFAPELKVMVVTGSKPERRDLLAGVEEADVVITSYPLLRRDSADFSALTFSCCFFDEAQYIKNPHSQTAQCARKLQAGQRFALTGTPMENALTELWSIFQCIMPGYLYSHKKFMQKFGSSTSADREAREQASRALAARVRPFILRRLKTDVLSELPPKIEHKLLSELTRDQKKLYTAYLEKLRGETLLGIEGEGFDKSRIKILAGLTRLRQICCHPALFVDSYQGESAKLLQLEELLREAVGGGHRILLFSQFTEMLKLIRGVLERERYRYFYLDGSTKSEERLHLADAFNGGGAEIFLISLKAGGTGLNLTGADIVVQYDLWWNPAVEEQAAGRAHRIGQQKVVQVIRMLARGTIEEKIDELQQQKKELIDRVIQPGETFLSSMSEADIRHILDLDG